MLINHILNHKRKKAKNTKVDWKINLHSSLTHWIKNNKSHQSVITQNSRMRDSVYRSRINQFIRIYVWQKMKKIKRRSKMLGIFWKLLKNRKIGTVLLWEIQNRLTLKEEIMIVKLVISIYSIKK